MWLVPIPRMATSLSFGREEMMEGVMWMRVVMTTSAETSREIMRDSSCGVFGCAV